jgi:hypothetical protein
MLTHVREELEGSFLECQGALRGMIEQIEEIAAFQGILHSEVTHQAIRKLCECEIINRSRMIWNAYARVADDLPASARREEILEIKQIIRGFMPRIVEEMAGHVRTVSRVPEQEAIEPFDEVVGLALKKVDEDIDKTVQVVE